MAYMQSVLNKIELELGVGRDGCIRRRQKSCCFAKNVVLDLLPFRRSRCQRCRRCLSSLIELFTDRAAILN